MSSGAQPLFLRQENNDADNKVQPNFALAKGQIPICTPTTVFGVVFNVEFLEISTRVYYKKPLPDSVEFSILNQSRDTLRLNAIIPRPQITIKYDPLKILQPDSATVVRLLYNPIVPDTVCGCLNIILENLTRQPAECDTARLPYCAFARAPQIKVDKRLIDFGDVVIGSAKIDKMVLSNAGDTTLTINRYDTSLGLMFDLLSPLPPPKTIQGGKSETFRFQFAPIAAADVPVERAFTIHNDTFEPRDTVLTVTLRGRGFTGPGIDFNPNPFPHAIKFKACLGMSDSTQVTLRNTGNQTLTVDSIRSANETIFPSPPERKITLQPGDIYDVNLRFIPKDAGEFRSYLYAVSNKAGGRDTIFVSGIAETASFRVAPTQTLLKPIETVVGESDSAAFFIDNASGCSLYVDTIFIEPVSSRFDVSVRKATIEPLGQIPVWVRFMPNDNDTLLHTAKVVVKARYFAQPESLTVQGQGLSGAKFVLNPEQFDFGKVCLDQPSTREVRVRNTGRKSLVIRDIVATGDTVFTIWPKPAGPDSISIGPGGEHVFAVTYKPIVEPLDSAAFVFSTSRASGNKKLSVKGQGIHAELAADSLARQFGEITLQDSSIREIMLTNMSDHAIKIFDIEVIPNEGVFEVSPKSGILPEMGSSLMLTVKFKPQATEIYNSTLVIEHNAGCADDTISLRGSGIAPMGPTITNTSNICRQNIGQAINLTACFEKAGGSISQPMLHYHAGGTTQFDSVVMTPAGDGACYSATIPGTLVSDRGIEYYFTVEDEKGIKSRAPAAPQVYAVSVYLPDGLNGQSLPSGSDSTNYRMVSIPLILDKPEPFDVLNNWLFSGPDQTKWRLFDYRNGNLYELVAGNAQKVRPFEPGRAYWLINNQGEKSLKSGAGSTTPVGPVVCENPSSYNKYLSMTLEPGWNMIANPFAFSIPKESLHIVGDSTMIYDKLYAYDGDWKMAPPMLEPWTGYAIKLGKEAQVTFNPQSVQSGVPAQSDKPGNWTVQIIARTGKHEDAINYLGVRTDAQDQWDAHDLFEPPPIGAGVSLAFTHTDWGQNPDNYTGDFRAAFADGAVWEFEVKTTLKAPSTTLQFKNIQSVPGNFEIMLYDKNRGIAKDLRKQEHYIYTELGKLLPGWFELIVGTPTFTEAHTAAVQSVPDGFELHPNYPNPFNNETILSFSLPKATPVWLKIFDMMGRQVRVLSNGKVWEKGRHYLRWNGDDENGVKIGSSVYILSFQAGDIKMRRRVTLIK